MKLFLYSFLIITVRSFSQLPETDIWLVKLSKKNANYSYNNPVNITNRAGYDNQPVFINNDKQLFYVCIRQDNQADIYSYTINKKNHKNITNTKVSEYSPTVLPNNLGFSCVVVEPDSAQRVWQYDFNGKFTKITHQATDSVGYHTWLTADTLLYFKLTEPQSLRALNLKTNEDVWLCNNPSRAFKKINNSSHFIYAIKDSSKIEFRIYNPQLRQSAIYCSYNSTNEDFVWHNELGLIKAEGANLLRYNDKNKTWETLFSFANLGVKKITRFVFDSKNKQLAFVSNL